MSSRERQLLQLTPQQQFSFDCVKYPYIALNTTTNKLYAYTHPPEWSGVDCNFFKVEGKQKRIPYEPFACDVFGGCVYQCLPALLTETPKAEPIQSDIFKEFDKIYSKLDNLIAEVKVCKDAAKAVEIGEMPLVRIMRLAPSDFAHFGIPKGTVCIIKSKLTGSVYAANSLGLTTKELPNFNMCGYNRINLVEWN